MALMVNAPGAIQNKEIEDNSVSNIKLQSNSVSSSKILDGSIVESKIDPTLNVKIVKTDLSSTFTSQQRPHYTNNNSVSTTSSIIFNPNTFGQIATVSFSNSITVTFGAPTNIIEGAMYKFILKATDTNTRTFVWNSAYKFPNALPALETGTSVLNAVDIISFIGGPSNTLIFDGKISNVY